MDALSRALLSLKGVATGDAFGERLFGPAIAPYLNSKVLPNDLWHWTDDTAMAISIVENLRDFGGIEQDALAKSFGQRYNFEQYRGYGGGAHILLERLYEGDDWRKVAPSLFDGKGSYGNGAAMRIAPLGAFFSGYFERAKEEAIKSAEITHSHSEGKAGAIAVAVASSITASQAKLDRIEFISLVESYVPDSEVRTKLNLSKSIEAEDIFSAIRMLGTGRYVSAQDTVPFCIWCASNNLYNFEAALAQTVSGFGDQDTTCAIVGGIVALSSGEIPEHLWEHVELLPEI